MLKLGECLELLPPQFILFLDILLIMFTSEMFCYSSSLTALAYVRFQKELKQQIKKTQLKKVSEQIFLKRSFSKMGTAITNEIYQSVSQVVV